MILSQLLYKVKVKLSLRLSKYQAMETYPVLNYTPRHGDIWGVEV